MLHQHYLSDEQLLDYAYDIFLELAADNLTPHHIELFNLYFKQYGQILLYTPDQNDWQEYVHSDKKIDEGYAEIVIALNQDEQRILFARLLISRINNDTHCFILWNGE